MLSFKKILPSENYTLVTKLPAAEVLQRISDNTIAKRPVNFFGYSKTDKKFEGLVSENGFKITPIINYRNSFLPVITGEVSSFLSKTHVRIRMEMPGAVKAFMLLWLGSISIVCIAFIFLGIKYFRYNLDKGFTVTMFIPFFMLIAGFIIMNYGFKPESKKAKKLLENLFEATESTPINS